MCCIGFLININNLKLMSKELLYNNNIYNINYLLTYKLSQDHLEIYFGCIRRMGGNNTNPSPLQFTLAYKKLLLHNSVEPSFECNVTKLDGTHLINIDDTILINETSLKQLNVLSLFSSSISNYISGFVVKKLKNIISCELCLKS